MRREWTLEEEKILLSGYCFPRIPVSTIAKKLNRTLASILLKARRLGVTEPEGTRQAWTDKELVELYAFYENSRSHPRELAKRLNRSYASVTLKASRLGLTEDRGVWVRLEEERIATGERVKDWIAKKGHPKGMQGKRHTVEAKRRTGEGSKRNWEHWKGTGTGTMSEENRQKQSDRGVERVKSGAFCGGYSRTKSGKRADLNDQFFRSSWEANYARYLNFLVEVEDRELSWEFEPDTFWFNKIKRGTRSYTPDFKIIAPNEDPVVFYVEIKGWLDKRSRIKLKRMKLYYPDILIVMVGAKKYRSIEKACASRIPEWEYPVKK